MMLTARSRSILAPLVVFAIFLGVIWLRALPAWFRGSYTTEGGVWLSQMWQLGFFKSLSAIRPDYCVFGNLVVIQISEWINALLHGANLDHAPSIQHHMACAYAAAMFTVIFYVLRRNHSLAASFLVCGVMLLMPDLDGENRIFGEVTNLGYFSALVVLFIYHDLWISLPCSRRRLIAYLMLVMFHIATSPLAGLICVAFTGMLVLREAITRFQNKKNVADLLPHLIPVVFAIFTILRAQVNSPYVHYHADAAQLKARLVDVVLCRQVLYPLVLNFYTWFNDARTLFFYQLLMVLIGAWIVLEQRRWPLFEDARGTGKRPFFFEDARITGLLLLFATALGMAVSTVMSRQWLIQHEEGYNTVWPARYYLAQNMVAGAFMTLLLLRIARLLPRARAALMVFAVLMLGNYAELQMESIRAYLRQDDPAILARHWPYQLRRAHAVQTMTGDQGRALKSGAPGLLNTVEINIKDHSMELSPEKIEKAAATRLQYPPDECPVGFAEPGQFAPDTGAKARALSAQNLRVIPRTGGVLVSFDVLMNDVPRFNPARRHLWIGRLPGKIQARCFGYSVPVSHESEVGTRSGRRSFNWLFKVLLYIDELRSLAELERQLSGLTCALGSGPEKYIALGTVLQPHDRPCLSSILGDEKFAARLHPLHEIFQWTGPAESLHLRNLGLRKGELVVDGAVAADFDETAYLRYNPDIAGAVARKSLASGHAHFTEFGWKEARQIRRCSATLDVSQQQLDSGRVGGIRVVLKKGRKEVPPLVSCVLHGDDGRETAFRLLPPDGGLDFCTLFVPPVFKPAPHALRSIEIEFEGVTSERTFRLQEIVIYQSKDS